MLRRRWIGFVMFAALAGFVICASPRSAFAANPSTITWPKSKTAGGQNYTGPIWTAVPNQNNQVIFDITNIGLVFPSNLTPVSAQAVVYVQSATVPGTWTPVLTTSTKTFGVVTPIVNDNGNSQTNFTVGGDANSKATPFSTLASVQIIVTVVYMDAQKNQITSVYPALTTTPIAIPVVNNN